MFKPIIAALFAATALIPPAFAQDHGHHGNGGGNRGGRAESSQSGGSDRGTSYRSAPRPQYRQSAPQAQAYRAQPNGGNQPQRVFNQPRQPSQYRGSNGQSYAQQARPAYQDRGQRSQYRGNGNGNSAQDWRAQRNGGRDWNRGGNRGGAAVNANRSRYGNDRYRGDRGNGWNNGWRRDNRYDWRDYRNSHRSNYRLPRYYAPRGWGYGYRRFGIGATLSSLLFGESYWINDPFYYRLPPAYGDYRWVRYYNDALLVDIYSGEVVDVEYDIFW